MAAAAGEEEITLEQCLENLQKIFQHFDDMQQNAQTAMAQISEKEEQLKSEGKLGPDEKLKLEMRRSQVDAFLTKTQEDLTCAQGFLAEASERLKKDREELELLLVNQPQRRSDRSA